MKYQKQTYIIWQKLKQVNYYPSNPTVSLASIRQASIEWHSTGTWHWTNTRGISSVDLVVWLHFPKTQKSHGDHLHMFYVLQHCQNIVQRQGDACPHPLFCPILIKSTKWKFLRICWTSALTKTTSIWGDQDTL